MKTLKRIVCIIPVLLTIYACSGIRVSEDYEQGYDFSKLKTFAWKKDEKSEYGVTNNDLLDNRIRSAITNNLLAKNYRQTDSDKPDFFISYHVNIEQKVSNTNVSGGISLGRSSGGSFGSIGISTGSRARVYTQGALLIDVTDALNNQLVWRGNSTQPVSGHSDPEKSTALINDTVAKVLSQFPPKQ